MTVENVVAGGLHRVLRSRFSKQANVRHLGQCQGRLMDSSSLTHELSSFAVPRQGSCVCVCLFLNKSSVVWSERGRAIRRRTQHMGLLNSVATGPLQKE